MSQSKQSGGLYRVVQKKGTHLAESKNTPGAFRGTLLSDGNRQLVGQAEFVKIDENELENDYSLQHEYQESHCEVELTEEQEDMTSILGIIIAEVAIWITSELLVPHIQSWWQKKAAPSIKKMWQGISEKKAPQKDTNKRQLRATQIIDAREPATGFFTQELDESYEKYVNDMTSEEAQQELLDIFMLSAVVAAKMRKLANARIRDKGNTSGGYIDGKVIIERLSTPQFVDSINIILESNPRLLEEMSAPLTDNRRTIRANRKQYAERNTCFEIRMSMRSF